jgi:hypothetical protein
MKSVVRCHSLLELQDLRRPDIAAVLFSCIPAHFIFSTVFYLLPSLFFFTLFVPSTLLLAYVLFSGLSYSDVEVCGFSVRK